jgi:hypothetical protein
MTLLPGTKVIAKYDLDGASQYEECMILKHVDNLYLAIGLSDSDEMFPFLAGESDFEVVFNASDLVYHKPSGKVCVFHQEDANGYCIAFYDATELFYASADEITKIPFNFYDAV